MATLLHRTPPHPEASGGGFRFLPWEHGDYHDGMGLPTTRSGVGPGHVGDRGVPATACSRTFSEKEKRIQIGGRLEQLAPVRWSWDGSERGL